MQFYVYAEVRPVEFNGTYCMAREVRVVPQVYSRAFYFISHQTFG